MLELYTDVAHEKAINCGKTYKTGQWQLGIVCNKVHTTKSFGTTSDSSFVAETCGKLKAFEWAIKNYPSETNIVIFSDGGQMSNPPEKWKNYKPNTDQNKVYNIIKEMDNISCLENITYTLKFIKGENNPADKMSRDFRTIGYKNNNQTLTNKKAKQYLKNCMKCDTSLRGIIMSLEQPYLNINNVLRQNGIIFTMTKNDIIEVQEFFKN